jgi:hypothetical protein
VGKTKHSNILGAPGFVLFAFLTHNSIQQYGRSGVSAQYQMHAFCLDLALPTAAVNKRLLKENFLLQEWVTEAYEGRQMGRFRISRRRTLFRTEKAENYTVKRNK